MAILLRYQRGSTISGPDRPPGRLPGGSRGVVGFYSVVPTMKLTAVLALPPMLSVAAVRAPGI
ncbi:hypothetical protein IU468_26950 [Nocardia farcinica]|uniref:hypothetical protein n=1 Tax=Nocardia TaxID=1817 RepID=UPI001561FB45|nr:MULTISPECIES: hypothetical protein [Nocardia]MBF6259916.1 hypothetical protein [Nocardia farcinica]MBF6266310.1 hypothetical protein [Nocardia farcinica]MBF6574944.1 hypothetical protein [Nocardia farcinica]MCZ9325366.1 hypothetical protein [Nocardia farcinica]